MNSRDDPVHISDDGRLGTTIKQFALAAISILIGLPFVLFGLVVGAAVAGSAAGIL